MKASERISGLKAMMDEAKENWVKGIREELKGRQLPLEYATDFHDIGVSSIVNPDGGECDSDVEWTMDSIRYNELANDFEVHICAVDGRDDDEMCGEWESLGCINFTDGTKYLDVLGWIQWPEELESVK